MARLSKHIYGGAVAASLVAASSAFPQNRSAGFTTRPGGAILCPNYFAIKEAKAAAKAQDEKWFKSIGCVLAPEGWSVTLIDAPINRYDFKMIWYGWVFPPGSTDRINFYFDQYDVATAALSTISFQHVTLQSVGWLRT